jgi:anaerobic ribonucleoside-triphosphate reductase activating protein
MNYAGIITDDIANGDGIRTSLFVSGCRNNCEGIVIENGQSLGKT